MPHYAPVASSCRIDSGSPSETHFSKLSSQGNEKARAIRHQILPLADGCPFLSAIAICHGRQSGQGVRGRPGDKNPTWQVEVRLSTQKWLGCFCGDAVFCAAAWCLDNWLILIPHYLILFIFCSFHFLLVSLSFIFAYFFLWYSLSFSFFSNFACLCSVSMQT